jgi:tetratricopeptide (TPR) repeat protein
VIGTFREGLEFCLRLEKLLDRTDQNASLLNTVLVCKVEYFWRLGLYHQAKNAANNVLESALTVGEETNRSAVFNILGTIGMQEGKFSEARVYFEKSLTLARVSGHKPRIAFVLGDLANCLHQLGDDKEVESYFLEAQELHRQAEHTRGLVNTMNNLANFYVDGGFLEKAKKVFQEGLGLARDVGYQQVMPFLLANLSEVYEALGDYGKARDLNLEALERVQKTGEQFIRVAILSNLTYLSAHLSDFEKAWNYSESSLQEAKTLGATTKLLQALSARGDLYAKQGYSQEAIKLLYFVAHHPNADTFEKNRSSKILETLKSSVGPEVFLKAANAAYQTNLEKILQEVHSQPSLTTY